MPKFTVTGLGGKQVTVTGNEGSTQQQAQAAYDQHLEHRAYNRRQQDALQGTQQAPSTPYNPYAGAESPKAVAEAYEQVPWYLRPGVGMAASVDETIQGAKQLFGANSPETAGRANLYANIPHDALGQAGYLAGEIGQLYGPVGGAARLGKGAAALTDIGASTLQGGLKSVPQGADPMAGRMQNAALGAAGGALGYMPGGISPTAGATALRQQAQGQGVPMRLTPAQAGGKTWQVLEQGLEAFPIVGGVVRQHQERGLKDWNRVILNEVAPVKTVTDVGQAGLRQVDEQFREAYGDVIGRAPERITLDDDALDALDSIQNEYKQVLTRDQWDQLSGETSVIIDRGLTGDIPRGDLKRSKSEFQKLAQAAYNRGEVRLGDALMETSEQLSAQLMRVLPEEAAARLQLIDGKYRNWIPVQTAHNRLGSNKRGYITPNDLLSAARAEDKSLRKKRFATGQQPMQDAAQAGEETLGRRLPDMGPGTAEKLMMGAGLVGAVTDPVTTAAVGGAGVGLAAGTHLAAPLARGSIPGQSQFRSMVSNAPYGAPSQVGESALTAMFGQDASAGEFQTPESVSTEALDEGIQMAAQVGARFLERTLRQAKVSPSHLKGAVAELEQVASRARQNGDGEMADYIERLSRRMDLSRAEQFRAKRRGDSDSARDRAVKKTLDSLNENRGGSDQ